MIITVVIMSSWLSTPTPLPSSSMSPPLFHHHHHHHHHNCHQHDHHHFTLSTSLSFSWLFHLLHLICSWACHFLSVDLIFLFVKLGDSCCLWGSWGAVSGAEWVLSKIWAPLVLSILSQLTFPTRDLFASLPVLISQSLHLSILASPGTWDFLSSRVLC